MTAEHPTAEFVTARIDRDAAELEFLKGLPIAQGYLRVSGDLMQADIDARRSIVARHPGATAEDECPGCGAHLDGTWVTPPGAVCPELAALAQPRLGDEPGTTRPAP